LRMKDDKDESWRKYSSAQNKKIEKAFQSDEETVILDKTYRIDLKRKIQYRASDPDRQRAIKRVADSVKWYWKKDLRLKDDNVAAWQIYSKADTKTLEAAFASNEESCELEKKYQVDLKEMVQSRLSDDNKQRPVRRIAEGESIGSDNEEDFDSDADREVEKKPRKRKTRANKDADDEDGNESDGKHKKKKPAKAAKDKTKPKTKTKKPSDESGGEDEADDDGTTSKKDIGKVKGKSVDASDTKTSAPADKATLFEGLVLAVCGPKRESVEKLIATHGGEVATSVTARTDIVISHEEKAYKVNLAADLAETKLIHILKDSWIDASLAAGKLVDKASHAWPAATQKIESATSKKKPAGGGAKPPKTDHSEINEDD